MINHLKHYPTVVSYLIQQQCHIYGQYHSCTSEASEACLPVLASFVAQACRCVEAPFIFWQENSTKPDQVKS